MFFAASIAQSGMAEQEGCAAHAIETGLTRVGSHCATTEAETNEVFVAMATEIATYEADGSFSGNGRWSYNLVRGEPVVQRIEDPVGPVGARQRAVVENDQAGRRIGKGRLVRKASGAGFGRKE
jgi:hypothetical protein